MRSHDVFGFGPRLLSFSTMSKSFHAQGRIIFVCSYSIFFVHSSGTGHLGYFSVWTVVDSAMLSTAGRYSYSGKVILFDYIPRRGITGLWQFYYCFFRSVSAVFFNVCNKPRSPEQCTSLSSQDCNICCLWSF